jgi:hypothetical protein
MVVDIVNIFRAVFETENHPPVGPDSYGPEALEGAFEAMQPESRQIHMGDGRSGVKRCQNIPQLFEMFRTHAARIVLLKEPFQTFVPDRPNNPRT